MSYRLKNNIIAKIICVSIVFFIKLIYILVSYFQAIINRSKEFFVFILIILYNFGEERLINNSRRDINFPHHIGIVLTKENFNQKFLKNFLKTIHWTLLFQNIKHLNIYDPFEVIDENNRTIVANSLSQIFNKNFSILFVTKNFHYDCKLRENKEKEDKSFLHDVKKYDLVISLIGFESANQNLIDKTCNNYLEENVLPDELSSLFQVEKKSASPHKDLGNSYHMFFTRKFAEYLPELVLFFGDEEICLYGYPFVLLENSEIIKAGNISAINVVKYLEIFQRYSKINKRFGK